MEGCKTKQLGLLVLCVLALTACGGGDGDSSSGGLLSASDTEPNIVDAGDDGDGDTPEPVPDDESDGETPSGIGSPVGSAHTIALTFPQTNSIEDLGGGIYRRIVSAIVTDSQGIAVNDGTVIDLRVIDSVLAQGNLAGSGDSATGVVLTDNDVTLGDGFTGSGFDMAYVLRNDAVRFIEQGDHIYLISADEEDKSRTVAQIPDSNVNLSVSSPYNRDYPNEDYDGDPAPFSSFVVGASLLGANVAGSVDGQTDLVEGFATTKEGIATFFITYPANVDTISSGCNDIPEVDERSLPVGSAVVYLVASVQGNENVTAVDEFCFAAIDGGEINVDDFEQGEGIVELKVEMIDGGDKVPLPYEWIIASSESDNVVLSESLDFTGAGQTLRFRTGASGARTIYARGEPGVNADVSFIDAGVGTEVSGASVTIEIPEAEEEPAP